MCGYTEYRDRKIDGGGSPCEVSGKTRKKAQEAVEEAKAYSGTESPLTIERLAVFWAYRAVN